MEGIRLSPMKKALTLTENLRKQSDSTKAPQKILLHNDCGPTKGRQLE